MNGTAAHFPERGVYSASSFSNDTLQNDSGVSQQRTLKRNEFRAPRRSRSESGLTLVEILVASTLLVLITLGLMLMFDQAQRAFRAGVKQVDVLEGGRAALEMMARDLELMADAGNPYVTNFAITNVNGLTLVNNDGTTPLRTNRIQEVYWLTHLNNDWIALGYTVTNNSAGVGSLHRFSLTNQTRDLSDNWLFNTFRDQTFNQRYQTNFHRVIDGVVHFQIHALNGLGQILNPADIHNEPRNQPSRAVISFPLGTTNLPSALELELGILEPQTVEQIRGMPDSTTATNFLAKRPDKVHIFRRQIPIRPAR